MMGLGRLLGLVILKVSSNQDNSLFLRLEELTLLSQTKGDWC